MVGEARHPFEDRQLLLDAIGAAQETLVVTYTGADEHTGRRHPRACRWPVLDTWIAPPRYPSRTRSSPRIRCNRSTPATSRRRPQDATTPFTFDVTALVAAEAASRPEPVPDRDFLAAALPPRQLADVALDELLGFYNHPVKGFFRDFAIALPSESDVLDDAIPVEMDNLAGWAVGNRMLGTCCAGTTRSGRGKPNGDAVAAAPASSAGGSPVKRGGRKSVGGHRVPDTARAPSHPSIWIWPSGPTALTGTVTPVHGAYVAVGYSSWAPKSAAGLDPAARTVRGRAGTDWTAVCIGRRGRNGELMCAPSGGPSARRRALAELVAIYDAGLREPLPLPLKTSYAWAVSRRTRDDPEREAQFHWAGGEFAENGDDAHARAWGERAPLSTY